MGCYFNLSEFQEEGQQIQFKGDKIEYTKKLFQAYLSIKDMIKWIKQAKTGSIDAYLVSKKSVNKFITKLINSGVLTKIIEDNDILEQAEADLKKNLKDYKLEKIKILDCQNINNNNDEEFIIVNEKFIKSIDNNLIRDIKKKKVEIKIDNTNKKFYIKINREKQYFKETNLGIFSFCNKNEILKSNYESKCNSSNSGSNNNMLNSINSKTNINEASSNEIIKDNLTSKIANVLESKEISEKNK